MWLPLAWYSNLYLICQIVILFSCAKWYNTTWFAPSSLFSLLYSILCKVQWGKYNLKKMRLIIKHFAKNNLIFGPNDVFIISIIILKVIHCLLLGLSILPKLPLSNQNKRWWRTFKIIVEMKNIPSDPKIQSFFAKYIANRSCPFIAN